MSVGLLAENATAVVTYSIALSLWLQKLKISRLVSVLYIL